MASTNDGRAPDPQVEPRSSTRRFPAASKARILAEYEYEYEYEDLDRAGTGALLRREGL